MPNLVILFVRLIEIVILYGRLFAVWSDIPDHMRSDEYRRQNVGFVPER